METCVVFGCEREHCAKGYCSAHYARLRTKRGLDPKKALRTDPRPCAIDGCERHGRAGSGLCAMHYQRQRAGIPMDRPARRERFVNANGYIYTWAPDSPEAQMSGMALEHRLVMARHLGRALLKRETVHHKNGDKTDNRLGNLELMRIGSHPAGQRVYTDLVPYALEVLATYAPEHLAAKPTQIELGLEKRAEGKSKFGLD